MPSRVRLAIVALLSFGLSPGCAVCEVPRNDAPTAPTPAAATTPEMIRRVSAEVTTPPAPAGSGVPLDAEQCRCLAARQAVPARLIDQEWQWVGIASGRNRCQDDHPYAVHQQLLLYRAELRRNEIAAVALDLFFRLSEAKPTALLLEQSVQQLDRSRSDLQTLRRQGIAFAQDPTELDRSRLQLLEQKRLLEGSVVQANAQLRYLLGMDPVHGPPIYPVVGGPLATVPIDVEQAVATGLAMRPDLNLLRLVIHEVDRKTLPAALGVLQQVEASLGAPAGGSNPLAFLKSLCDDTAVDVRRAQLITLLQDRERALAAEVRRAVESVEMSVRQVGLAEQTVASWQGRLDDLEDRLGGGTVTPFDISMARLRLLEARTVLVQRTSAARISEARLFEAQGILAAGCADAQAPIETPHQ